MANRILEDKTVRNTFRSKTEDGRSIAELGHFKGEMEGRRDRIAARLERDVRAAKNGDHKRADGPSVFV